MSISMMSTRLKTAARWRGVVPFLSARSMEMRGSSKSNRTITWFPTSVAVDRVVRPSKSCAFTSAWLCNKSWIISSLSE